VARLTAAQRRLLKPSQFAVPERDGYPLYVPGKARPDPLHVQLAKGRLTQFGRRLTRKEEREARRRIASAEAKLGGKPRSVKARKSDAELARMKPETILRLKKWGVLRLI
jgi:hypothetical protein